MIRIGINGFGRIGRQVFKAVKERYPGQVLVAAVNDLCDVETSAHLLKYDSSYGVYASSVDCAQGKLIVDGVETAYISSSDPSKIPWGDLGVDVVVESTGLFRSGDKAGAHIKGGAKKVIISAPGKDVDATFVMGVNHTSFDPAKHNIFSNASCTTNCLAPPAKVIHEKFGIGHGLMTTVHSYTSDQRILDAPHKDLRRARTAGASIIPTTTGAAKAVALVLPDLKGRFDGISLRVPTPSVSLVDLTMTLEKPADTEALRQALVEAAQGELKGIMACEAKPLVSIDFKGNPHSSIVDLEYTSVQPGGLAKLMAWYDNEWGYSCRTADLAAYVGARL
ncbi:glyceraldehyde-3-phosphate dehydrogenase, type I [Desulfarculus baarsii DSM 2075]|uniref:Glyceraldehyde-3-phosphate dehydrogenase n=1 Tax=Desulfarculus baarsii (strain ATCC 33931 / DSM 2075 / LMG 7858 / VKM B-1802 / 2st14) TaxID=644282 RepID=E1QEC3_DESB2|nr:type I glyceraldehyde-3-phosphate dehydrogenase [Desulfarculus baarsii]ADK83909.1 glyceraldehyde-3-phosphate dehydrogenase, type I [Desulfarculus baarsii DSM 2075]